MLNKNGKNIKNHMLGGKMKENNKKNIAKIKMKKRSVRHNISSFLFYEIRN